MTDEGRFNVMPKVAEKLGYNLNDNTSLWRDAALNVVNEVQSVTHNLLVWLLDQDLHGFTPVQQPGKAPEQPSVLFSTVSCTADIAW